MKVTEEILSIAEEITREYVDALVSGRGVMNTDRKRAFTQLELIDEIEQALSVVQTYYLQKEE